MKAQDSLPAVIAEARHKAKQTNKPIYYYFYADWCPNCSDFEAFILGSPYLQPFTKDYFKCRLDLSHIERWELYVQKHFGMAAVPALAIESQSGKRIQPLLFGSGVSLQRVRNLLLLGFDIR